MEEGLWEEGSGFAYGEIMHCSPLIQIFWGEYGKYTIPGLMHTFLITIQIFITNQEIILQPAIKPVKLYKKG